MRSHPSLGHERTPATAPSRRTVLAAAAGAAATALPGTTAAADPPPTGPGRPVPTGLLADLLPRALGLPTEGFLLSWQVPPLGDGRQTHHQVQIAATPGRLVTGPRVWDSGTVASAASVSVPYGGPPLAPGTAYWWRVRTRAGAWASGWSEPTLLATAADRWTADPVWVAPGPDPSGPDDTWALLRHEFRLPPGEVAAGILRVAALSPVPARQYPAKLWCNGAPAGYASVRSSAGDPRYASLDVTDALRPGAANVLAALCWTTSDQRFLAQLDVVFADGSRATIGSGTAWRARRQDGLLPDHGSTGGGYYTAPQEYWDLRHEPAGWTEPGFDDSAWPAAVRRPAIAALAPAPVEPVRLHDVTPAAVRRVADGHWLVDLGREIAGGLALRVDGRAGQEIEVRLGEELNADGTVRYALRAGPVYREVWTLRDGPQRVEHWGYRGFRYAELLCDPGLELTDAVTGRAWRLDWRDADSSFASSDPDLDRVWEFCRYSIEATRGDLYQDTPTRERGPYEGDALINQLSEYAVQRSYALARYSGSYLTRNGTWPTEYRLMCALIAWRDYLHTGDARRLGADYDLLAAKNLTAWLGPDDLVHKAPGTSSKDLGDLVDWPVACRDGYVFTDTNTVVNAFQYAAFDALAKIADALGRGADATRWRAQAGRTGEAMRATLLDTAQGRFVDGAGTTHSAQHATAFPLALGVAGPGTVPDRVLRELGATLAAGGMRTSVYGAQFLLDALFAAGRADAALALLTARDTTSWLHMLDDLGATIVTEAWDPSLKPNMTFSHAWASAPVNAVARHVLGVEVSAPGAAAFTIRPRLGALTRVHGTVPSIRGPVAVAVERTPPGAARPACRLTATVPPNATARLLVEIGDDDPGAYRLRSAAVRGGRPVPGRVLSDVTGTVLEFGPVGPGTATVLRDGR